MVINQMQIQPDLLLAEFMQGYGTEVQCAQALAADTRPRS